jgi:uncharacterized protein with HEPN domain
VRRGRGRSATERLEDVLDAIRAIRMHLERGGLEDSLVFDAVRMRIVEIGEAINDVPVDLLATESEIPWKEVVGMRHKLAHHYFDTAHGIVAGTVREDLPVLEAAVLRMIGRSN